MAMEKHFIQEGVIRSQIENFLRKELSRAGYSGIKIQKTPLTTRVTLYVEKPPLVIGKRGKRIDKLTTTLSEKYGIESPSIDVQRIENPTLDPSIIARRIAVALERGMNRRRVVYKAVRAVMGSGARGIEIVLSGKLVGKGGRSRSEKYNQGYMKKAGESAKLVRIGRTQAYLKAGVIGVTAKIVPPDAIFPDQISIIPKTQEVDKAQEKAPENEKVPEEKTSKKETAKKEASTDKNAPKKATATEKKVKKAKADKPSKVDKKEVKLEKDKEAKPAKEKDSTKK